MAVLLSILKQLKTGNLRKQLKRLWIKSISHTGQIVSPWAVSSKCWAPQTGVDSCQTGKRHKNFTLQFFSILIWMQSTATWYQEEALWSQLIYMQALALNLWIDQMARRGQVKSLYGTELPASSDSWIQLLLFMQSYCKLVVVPNWYPDRKH